MAKTSADEERAIAWWCEKNNLVPQMSIYPEIRFRDKDTGEYTARNVKNLATEYKKDKKERQKAERKGKKK